MTKTIHAPGAGGVSSFIAYYRVSTQQQGRSGLGLDAQREAVAKHIAAIGGELVDTLEEVESGKNSARPALAQALAACRARKATLIIAKLGRLARNAAFLLGIVEGSGKGGVVFCDLPQVPPGPPGKFVISIMAAVAELEAGLISQRTKAALAQAKMRGVKLGNPCPVALRKAQRAGAAANRMAADAFADRVLPLIAKLQREGHITLRAITAELQARGIPTARGGRWSTSSVRNLVARMAPVTALAA